LNTIGSFGAGTNGDEFYTRYLPYMNSLNLMVSTIANTRVKVLSTQVHDRINQFDYLSTTALYSDGNLTKEIRTQGDAFMAKIIIFSKRQLNVCS
jgi:hypothetical protein